eukprot:gene24796-10441_t
MVKVAIIPGNGAGNVHNCNFYGWLHRKLHHPPAVTSVLRNMPDPITAKESIWLPFMEDELGCDEDCIIVGHSSGACAAVRYAEKKKVRGIILVGAYTTDGGDANEAASGYFNRPWDWAAAKANAGFCVVFGSTDDPFLPWNGLGAELHKFEDRGHFMDSQFPELLNLLRDRISKANQEGST